MPCNGLDSFELVDNGKVVNIKMIANAGQHYILQMPTKHLTNLVMAFTRVKTDAKMMGAIVDAGAAVRVPVKAQRKLIIP